MAKSKTTLMKEKKEKNRTYKEGTGFGNLQDRITELEMRIEELRA